MSNNPVLSSGCPCAPALITKPALSVGLSSPSRGNRQTKPRLDINTCKRPEDPRNLCNCTFAIRNKGGTPQASFLVLE